VCIAGGATNILTAEPAVAIPSDNDDMLGYGELSKAETPMSCYPSNVDGTVKISSQLVQVSRQVRQELSVVLLGRVSLQRQILMILDVHNLKLVIYVYMLEKYG